MASIKDVAQRAGVSISTVSRILNGTARVNPAKAAAVEEAIAFYRYEPNQFARGLVTQRSNMVGVYFYAEQGGLWDSQYNVELLQGAERVLTGNGFSIVLLTDRITQDPEKELSFYPFIRRRQIDGLLLSGLSRQVLCKDSFHALVEGPFPISYIGKRFHEKGMNVYAGFVEYHLRMLKTVYDLGHRKILLLQSPVLSPYISEVLNGSREAFADAEVRHIAAEPGQTDIAQILTRQVLSAGGTAICCDSFELAREVLYESSRLGISVPQRLSVVAVIHREDAGEQFGLSAFYVPARQMGQCAAEQLVQAIRGEPVGRKSIEFEAQYLPRATLAAVCDHEIKQ